MLPDINSYFQGINRGSQIYPNDVTTNLVLYNYIVINKLVKNPSFLHSMNQRKLSMYITMDVLANDELLFHVDSCGDGHSIEKIEEKKRLSGALLMHYQIIFCSKENDNITCKKLSKKRILRHKKFDF